MPRVARLGLQSGLFPALAHQGEHGIGYLGRGGEQIAMALLGIEPRDGEHDRPIAAAGEPGPQSVVPCAGCPLRIDPVVDDRIFSSGMPNASLIRLATPFDTAI